MTASFKRDDRVVATNTIFKMHGTVERLGAFTGLVRVRWDERPGSFFGPIAAVTEWVHPKHLAPLPREVSQETFSKGDVVEIVRPHPTPNYVHALGVVVEVGKVPGASGIPYKVRPYAPSMPHVQLSRGPFTYYAHELKLRKANGLVPVNFVREALGLKPAPERSSGFAQGGEIPKASILGSSTTLRILDEGWVTGPTDVRFSFRAVAELLEQPRTIPISDAMRRRGITGEAQIKRLVDGTFRFAETGKTHTEEIYALKGKMADERKALLAEASKLRARVDFTKRLLNDARAEHERSESRARDYADVNFRLRNTITALKNQLAAFERTAFSAQDQRTSTQVALTRAEHQIAELKSDLAATRTQCSFLAYQELADERRKLREELESYKAEASVLRGQRNAYKGLRDDALTHNQTLREELDAALSDQAPLRAQIRAEKTLRVAAEARADHLKVRLDSGNVLPELALKAQKAAAEAARLRTELEQVQAGRAAAIQQMEQQRDRALRAERAVRQVLDATRGLQGL